MYNLCQLDRNIKQKNTGKKTTEEICVCDPSVFRLVITYPTNYFCLIMNTIMSLKAFLFQCGLNADLWLPL